MPVGGAIFAAGLICSTFGRQLLLPGHLMLVVLVLVDDVATRLNIGWLLLAATHHFIGVFLKRLRGNGLAFGVNAAGILLRLALLIILDQLVEREVLLVCFLDFVHLCVLFNYSPTPSNV